jgi:hypothetical protein
MSHNYLYWDGFTKSARSDMAGRTYKSLFENAKFNNWEAVFSILMNADRRLTGDRRAINACELDSEQNNSLLHSAASLGADLAIVEQLIEFGALRNLRNNSEQKPIEVAKEQSHTHLFSILEPVNLFSAPVDELKLIEQHFHNVIMLREMGI